MRRCFRAPFPIGLSNQTAIAGGVIAADASSYSSGRDIRSQTPLLRPTPHREQSHGTWLRARGHADFVPVDGGLTRLRLRPLGPRWPWSGSSLSRRFRFAVAANVHG